MFMVFTKLFLYMFWHFRPLAEKNAELPPECLGTLQMQTLSLCSFASMTLSWMIPAQQIWPIVNKFWKFLTSIRPFVNKCLDIHTVFFLKILLNLPLLLLQPILSLTLWFIYNAQQSLEPLLKKFSSKLNSNFLQKADLLGNTKKE